MEDWKQTLRNIKYLCTWSKQELKNWFLIALAIGWEMSAVAVVASGHPGWGMLLFPSALPVYGFLWALWHGRIAPRSRWTGFDRREAVRAIPLVIGGVMVLCALWLVSLRDGAAVMTAIVMGTTGVWIAVQGRTAKLLPSR